MSFPALQKVKPIILRPPHMIHPVLKLDMVPSDEKQARAGRPAVQRKRMAFRQALLREPVHRPSCQILRETDNR